MRAIAEAYGWTEAQIAPHAGGLINTTYVVKQDGASADLEIVHDHMSDFYQWFYFRVAGGAGRELTLRITNCAGSAYPHGWPDYKGVMSLDREDWVRVSDTSYSGGVLTIKLPLREEAKPRQIKVDVAA